MIEVSQVEARSFEYFDQVLSLLQQAFAFMDGRIDPPSSLKRLDVNRLKAKAQSETLFIATHNDLLVGCVFAKPRQDYLYLGKLAVRSGYQGQGISRMLVERVERLAQQLQLPEVEIETRVELKENQQLFEHFGYVKTAENAHAGYQRATSFCYRKKVSAD